MSSLIVGRTGNTKWMHSDGLVLPWTRHRPEQSRTKRRKNLWNKWITGLVTNGNLPQQKINQWKFSQMGVAVGTEKAICKNLSSMAHNLFKKDITWFKVGKKKTILWQERRNSPGSNSLCLFQGALSSKCSIV